MTLTLPPPPVSPVHAFTNQCAMLMPVAGVIGEGVSEAQPCAAYGDGTTKLATQHGSTGWPDA
jgi:hypothetical protein